MWDILSVLTYLLGGCAAPIMWNGNIAGVGAVQRVCADDSAVYPNSVGDPWRVVSVLKDLLSRHSSYGTSSGCWNKLHTTMSSHPSRMGRRNARLQRLRTNEEPELRLTTAGSRRSARLKHKSRLLLAPFISVHLLLYSPHMPVGCCILASVIK
jgi:hypothetical protein